MSTHHSTASREIDECHSTKIDLLIDNSDHYKNLTTIESYIDKNTIKILESNISNPSSTELFTEDESSCKSC